MSGSQVLLAVSTAKTDAQAQLSPGAAAYTNATFSFTNPSESQGVYRIVDGNENYTSRTARTLVTTVEPKTEATLVAVGLNNGTGYNFYLERMEFGTWVKQGEKQTVVTKNITDVNVSTSSEAAVLTWDKTHESVYQVLIYNKSDTSKILQTVSDVSLNASTQKYEAVVPGLSNTVTYRASVQAIEQNRDNTSYFNQWQPLYDIEFTPSALANLNLDAVFSSYAELSWDDGDVGQYEEDEEADFQIRQQDVESGNWSTAMIWTPDTTKTLTVTGLVPGDRYQFHLRRRGVDGKSVFQDEIQNFVTTKTTEIRVGDTKSTALSFLWDEVYEGAVYRYGLTPAGGETTVRDVSGLSATAKNLAPDTDHTFELFVVEKGVNVSLGSTTARTDKSGILTLNQAQHTTLSLDVQSFSASEATYYVANEDSSIRTANFNLTGEVTHTVDIRGLGVNSTHRFSLFREEHGNWAKQSDYLEVATKAISAATSVASTSALVKWDQGYANAVYELNIYDTAPENDSVPILVKENTDISISRGVRSSIITGLEMETPYWGLITVAETNASGVVEKILVRPFNFDTSAGAVFQVGEVKASSVALSWDAGEVEEEDGVAEFKVRQQEVSLGSWTDATNWLPHDTNSFTKISGLKAGIAYKFQLVRLGLGGDEISQAIVDASTKTSTLTISGTGSTSIEAQWTELYPNAQYLLVYTAEGGDPVTFSGGAISGTSALLEGLESSTTYVIELYCVEEGVSVGLSTRKLGSAVSTKTGTSKVVIAGAAVMGVAVVGLIIYKVKTSRLIIIN